MARSNFDTKHVILQIRVSCGTKEFVARNYRRFKDIFMSKRAKIPTAVAGLDGIYSLSYGLQFCYASMRDRVYDFYSFQHILFMPVIQNVSSIETNTDSILEIFNAIEKMRCKG